MRILWICIEPLVPANTGGRVGILRRIERLAKHNEITLLFLEYEDGDDTIAYLRELGIRAFAFRKGIRSVRQALDLLWLPYTIASREPPDLIKVAKNLICNGRIDLINIDFPHMCRVVDSISEASDIPIVVNQHNIEWRVYREISKSSTSRMKSLLYWFDSFRLRRYERHVANEVPASLYTFVSEVDKAFYLREYNVPEDKLLLVPVGGDAHGLEACTANAAVTFVGNMSYSPNIEACLWFVKDVLPKIKSRCPAVGFFIVGKNPSAEIVQLEDEHVHVTGTVDSVEPYYRNSAIVVVPLRSGGGVKVKLIEAASYGKAIVATPKGIEGTLLDERRGVVVAEDAANFADACVSLLTDVERRARHQKRIYDSFESLYTWDAVCRGYEMRLRQLVKK